MSLGFLAAGFSWLDVKVLLSAALLFLSDFADITGPGVTRGMQA